MRSYRPPTNDYTLEFEIQFALEDACGLPNCDVRTINHAPIIAQGPIVQEGILLYERDQAQRISFEILVRKKYFIQPSMD